MKTGYSGSGHRTRRPWTSYHALGAILIITVLAVVGTILLAPRKPVAPPPSSISYEERRPEPEESDNGGPPDPRRRPRARVKVAEPESPAAADEASWKYTVTGTVTDARTGKALTGVHVRCQRALLPAQIARWRDAQMVVDRAKAKKTPATATNAGARSAAEAAEPSEEDLAVLDSISEEDVLGHGHETKTDARGRYRMRVRSSGKYVFSVYHDSYVPIRAEEVALEADSVELRKDFALSEGARISGRVTEAGASKGAPGIRVFVEGVYHESKTDEDGKYAASGLVPGSYNVTLDLSDAPYLAGGKIPSRNVTITHPTEEVRNVDFTVEAAGLVWGYVTTQQGEAVSGAETVLCTSASVVSQLIEASVKSGPPLHARSDKDGYYEMVGVPLNKEWRLYSMTDKVAPQLTAPFLLTSGQRTARVDIFMSNGTTVFGRVVSAVDRSPIPRADVLCIPGFSKFFSPLDSPHAFRPTNSKEDGTFEIPNLPIGEYQIFARKDGYKFTAMGEPVNPDGYSDIAGVEVSLTPVEAGKATVYGTVTDAEGRFIAGASLSLASMNTDDLSAGSSDTRSDAQGNYAFYGVQAGYLMLVVDKEGYKTQNVPNVRLDEPTNVVLESMSTVRGTVLVRETGSPPPSCTIQAMASATEGEGVSTFAQMIEGGGGHGYAGTDGNFTIHLAAGTYTLEARSQGLTPGRTSVTVSAGQDVDGVTIYMRQNGGRIQGRVTAGAGQSPSGAMVWIAGEAISFGPLLNLPMESGQHGVQVGADGAYEFNNLPAGMYTILAKLEGYAQGQAGPVQLGEGQSVAGINVALGGGGTLQGYVAFNGRLEPGAIVTAVGKGVSEMATSDANGQYRIDRLPAGSYLASAVTLNGNPMSGIVSPLLARVDIAEGQATTHNFGEPTNTALEGFCSPAPGSGMYAIAVLLIPGAPQNLAGFNFMQPSTSYQDASSLSQYIAGMATIDRDGYFRIDNIVQGDFRLDIFYLSLGEAMSGNVRQGYSDLVRIPPNQVTQVNIGVSLPQGRL